MGGLDDLLELFETHSVRYVFASSTERVHCFVSSGDEAGKLVWESDPINPATAPVVRGTNVYVLTKDAHVYALDFNEGHTLLDWTLTLEDEPKGFLAAAGGVLVFRAGYAGLLGFPLGTQQLWSRDIAYNPPAVGDDGRIYCADAYGTLHAITAEGVDVWTYGGLWESGLPGAGTSFYRNPVPLGGAVYAKADGKVVFLTSSGQFAGEALEGDDFWVTGGYAIGPGFAGGTVYMDAYEYNWMTGVQRGWLYAFDFQGNTIWQRPPVESGAAWLYTDPALDFQHVYVASIGGDANYRAYAFDVTTGMKTWQSDVSMGADYDWLSDIELEHGGGPNLFIASQDGHLYALSRADGKLAWKAELKAGSGIDFIPHKPTSFFSATPGFHLNIPDAIDPLALILPNWLYVAINKPYPPTRADLVDRLRTVTKGMSGEDRTHIRNRARAIGVYVALIEEAFAETSGEASTPTAEL